MHTPEQYLVLIDNYRDSIHAIVGFSHIHKYNDDTGEMNNDVLVFQGWRLKAVESISEENHSNTVTPDLGILLPNNRGMICEIKDSLPKDHAFWQKTFQQIKAYDTELYGWPSNNERVDDHELVLIPHLTRSAAVREYFRIHSAEIGLKKCFTIISFNRCDQVRPYYFFRVEGELVAGTELDKRLNEGISVPMKRLVERYSTVKLYDGEPPLPYLLEIIWTNIVTFRASQDNRFETLKKNQKIEVEIDVAEIAKELQDRHSTSLLTPGFENRNRRNPRVKQIRRACGVLVKYEEARWSDDRHKTVCIIFRKYTDVLEHFIDLCSKSEATDSPPLFGN